MVELLDAAERALAGMDVAEALAQTRAVIGAPALPVDETEAQRALDKMRNGEIPTDNEWVALQLVVRLMRPAVFTRHGTPQPLPPYRNRDQRLAELWARPEWAAAIPSVGRIDNAEDVHVGTGFVVGDGLVATNVHVVELLTLGTLRLLADSATMTFGGEYDLADSGDPVPITGVVACHPTLDLALLRVDGPLPAPVQMTSQDPGVDEYVVAIGYPGEVEPAPVHAPVFGHVYGLRRASPGLIRSIGDTELDHDCSTLGGSSGSPVLALASGNLVGVHHQGRSAYSNRAVTARHLVTMVGGAST